MANNAAGRKFLPVSKACRRSGPLKGPLKTPLVRKQKGSRSLPRLNKIVDSIEQAVLKSGLQDGMTISFHHHLRNGDMVLNMVMDVIANLGLKDLTIASSSLTGAHTPLIKHIEKGVVRRLICSGIRGELAEAVSHGVLDTPVLFHSHGGRARMIEAGELQIDVAFLAVPSCDVYGNANGYTGPSACGSLGYAKVDAVHAAKVVLITDNLVEYPNTPFSIHQDHVDLIVPVDQIGDPQGISAGALRMTRNPRDILIAQYASHVIEHSGYMEDGFSIQTGSGSISLAVTQFLRDVMLRKNFTASFALGGVTGNIVTLHEEGLIKRILDVQSFDQEAIRSIAENRYHTEIDASYYANPHNKGCATNKINVVVLSAMEIDTNFNVNVLTGSDGVIRGASGGHSDTAIGSGISIVVAPLIRGRTATVVESVDTIITPGETVDVLVTDHGVAVNPKRRDIYDRLKTKHLPLYSIEQLKQKAEKVTGVPEPVQFEDKIVGVVEYRDGTIIDVVYQVKDSGCKHVDKGRMGAILACREARVRRREQLQQEYGLPAVLLSMNIPGAEKNAPPYEKAHLAGEQEFLRRSSAAGLQVKRREIRHDACGREALFLIGPGSAAISEIKNDSETIALRLKRLCIQIEKQHPLGRIFDFDVYRGDGSAVGRAELQLPQRRCFLCDEPARVCARLGRHTAEDLQSYLFSLINRYFSQNRSSADAGTS